MRWKQTLLLQKLSFLYKKKAKAFSLQQLLNGQRLLRMPALSSFRSFGRSFSYGSFNTGLLNGKSMELCRIVKKEDCCLLYPRSEVKRHGLKILASLAKKFKLWWSGNEDKIGGVGILVREDLRMIVVEINRISDR